MFGHQDDQHHHHDDDNQPVGDVLSQPAADSVLSEDDHGDNNFNPALPTNDDHVFGDTPAPAAQDDFTLGDDSAPAPTTDDTPATSAPAISSDLLSIKQQALTELSPLVDHLEQTPEEKFRTTMMMIQASDNQDLISVAYEAAQNIQDEKVKAQALLDIVNEINYFTAQQPSA